MVYLRGIYSCLHDHLRQEFPWLDQVNPPPQNGCWLKSVLIFLKSTGFTSSTFPIQPDFSQNQAATITLNTGSPGTLYVACKSLEHK